MTRWSEERFTASDFLLDREIRDCRKLHAGRVDDLELSDPSPGESPVLTALLCGPTAFGPRIGGRLGSWWLAIGRRLRPFDDPHPVRIPVELIDHVNRRRIKLLISRENLDSDRFRRWVRDKVIGRIPGNAK